MAITLPALIISFAFVQDILTLMNAPLAQFTLARAVSFGFCLFLTFSGTVLPLLTGFWLYPHHAQLV
jgi:hypothetical protein